METDEMPRSMLIMNYCPRCGQALHDEFAFGRMRRACPACGFVFFREPKVAAGALVERDGKVLLVRRSFVPKKGYWALPAGYMEVDEGPVTTAIRECFEETGLIVRITGLFEVYYIANDPRGAGVLILYRARVESGELAAGDDASDVGFFAPDALPHPIAFASTRRALARWQCEKKS